MVVFASIEPVKYGYDAVCTITADDGMLYSVEELYRIAITHNIKFTVGVFINNISDLTRLQNIEKSGYIDFISHSYSHLNMREEGISNRILHHEIIDSKEYLEQYFTTSQLAFIPPNNQLSKEAYDVCKECFYAIRRWTRELNPLSPSLGEEPLCWLNLGCKGILDVYTTKERNEWVDECIREKKWLIEMWHDVDKNPSSRYQTINPSDAEEHIRYICRKRDDGKLWIASFVDAVKYIYEAQTCAISKVNVEGNVWKISLSEGIAENDSRFDMQLSARLNLSSNYGRVIVKRQNKKIECLKTRLIDNVPTVIFDMLPGEEVTVSSEL